MERELDLVFEGLLIAEEGGDGGSQRFKAGVRSLRLPRMIQPGKAPKSHD